LNSAVLLLEVYYKMVCVLLGYALHNLLGEMCIINASDYTFRRTCELRNIACYFVCVNTFLDSTGTVQET